MCYVDLYLVGLSSQPNVMYGDKEFLMQNYSLSASTACQIDPFSSMPALTSQEGLTIAISVGLVLATGFAFKAIAASLKPQNSE